MIRAARPPSFPGGIRVYTDGFKLWERREASGHMVEELHVVDRESCKGDGICVDICPEDVLELADGKAATVVSRAGHCILCGQCVAVCPNEALRMPKLPSEDFEDLAKAPFGYGEFLHFLRLRRSVRVFKDKPVESAIRSTGTGRASGGTWRASGSCKSCAAESASGAHPGGTLKLKVWCDASLSF
jgi:ferredoxin